MTVFPGFGGQAFMAEVLPKVGQVRRALVERGLADRVDVEVDGGHRRGDRAAWRRRPGRTCFVAGSAIFGQERPWEATEAIRRAVKNH